MEKYTMSEAAKIIGVSRQTIYNKIDRPDLQDHIQESEKGKVLTEDGLEVLKKILGCPTSTVNLQSIPVNDSKYMDNYIDSLTSQLEHLKEIITEKDRQSSEKDKQLSEKDRQLEALAKLIENSQVLLKQQQDKIFFLEDSHTKEQAKEKKSIWDIFKRN